MLNLCKTNTHRYFLHEQLSNQILVFHISAYDFVELIPSVMVFLQLQNTLKWSEIYFYTPVWKPLDFRFRKNRITWIVSHFCQR